MSVHLQLRVYRRRELCHTTTLLDSLQIGRQRPGEPAPYHFDASSSRLVLAPIDDKLVSREHLSFRPIAASDSSSSLQLEVSNLSRKRSVQIDTYGKLGPEETIRLPVPILVSFEDFAIRVEETGTGPWQVRSLDHQTIAPGTFQPGNSPSLIAQKSILQFSAKENYSAEQLIHWLGETMEVLQSAAGASDFLAQAVDAVDRIVGLDAIAALRYEHGEWRAEITKDAGNSKSGNDSRSPSRTILQDVLESKRTIFHVPAASLAAASLQGIRALVASPILNADGNVIGALYGARYGQQSMQLPQISELEATMVEVIACSAAAGMAREAQQQKALAARVQFEQFFTPQLARELELNPHMLDGHDAEISVLFCDIVGFSSVSQRIGSLQTMQWISDVMEHLSIAVLENEGVAVDYLGDELMAMWGAPKPQSDHATKACLAAADLMRCKQSIDQIWMKKVGSPIDFRIGICSGVASVGNTGSKRRLKYGPLGNTVNLASRFQNAAKQFGVRQLISQSTASQLENTKTLYCRPLGTAQFVNIPTPIEVFELGCDTDQEFPIVANAFAQIISDLKCSQLSQAQDRLKQLLADFPNDPPAQKLATLLASGTVIDPSCIWRFDTK